MSMRKTRRLVDKFAYPGFYPLSKVTQHPTIEDGRIITLRRLQKKLYVAFAEQFITHGMIEKSGLSEIYRVEMPKSISKLKYAVSSARSVAK